MITGKDAIFNEDSVRMLYDMLDAKRRAHGSSWRVIAKEIGVSASTLSRMSDSSVYPRAFPSVEGFAKMMRWLGVSADAFLGIKVAVPHDVTPPVLHLYFRFLRLPIEDQQRIAGELYLLSYLDRGKPHDLSLAALKRVAAGKQLHELWEEVEKILPDRQMFNPFPKLTGK